jgi:hypothetical protein
MWAPPWYDGELTPKRWRLLNRNLSKYAGILDRQEIITDFCVLFGVPYLTVEAMLATFRHLGPDTRQ